MPALTKTCLGVTEAAIRAGHILSAETAAALCHFTFAGYRLK
jgi:hypothetical protein